MDIETKKKELIDAYYFRHATKEFDSTKKISDDDFQFILETARLSPSSGNNEPWKFLVVQSPEFRKELAPLASGAIRQLPTASHFVLILARKGLTHSNPYLVKHITEDNGMPLDIYQSLAPAYAQFYNDLHLDTERALLDWSSKQTYLAMGNMMTAAAYIGIDSCAMEGFDLDAVNELLNKKGLLGDDEFGLSVMVAFGYRKENPKRPKSRLPLEEIVQYV